MGQKSLFEPPLRLHQERYTDNKRLRSNKKSAWALLKEGAVAVDSFLNNFIVTGGWKSLSNTRKWTSNDMEVFVFFFTSIVPKSYLNPTSMQAKRRFYLVLEFDVHQFSNLMVIFVPEARILKTPFQTKFDSRLRDSLAQTDISDPFAFATRD